MIIQPNEMNFSKSRFSMIIYGSPGIGKTTLALSAPSPLLLDFDKGVERVRAIHRKPTSRCSTYEEVLKDLASPEVADFETIVIDTGGSLITLLKDWAMRVKGAVQKNGEFNSLKGFGYIKTEFQSLTDYIKTKLDKNVIYVFHSEETKDKDGNPQQRLLCEGAAKNLVWQPCDFGGYLQMIGDKRIICFTPEQEFFAKGSHGISGRMAVPTLDDTTPNDFITKLFEVAKKNIKADADANKGIHDQYNRVMATVNDVVEAITNAEEATEAADELQKLDHVLTSKKEASALLTQKAASLSLRWDKDAKKYVSTAEAEKAEAEKPKSKKEKK